jgi:hypothetical protein
VTLEDLLATMLGPPAVARPRVPVLLPVAHDQTYD